LPKYKAVIFVHGCFWHQHAGCVHSGIPLTNQHYWRPKLQKTKKRDKANVQKLTLLGWHVFIKWECEIDRGRLQSLTRELRKIAVAN
jgi:DNA mismatch endonuclease (patch repair protein)